MLRLLLTSGGVTNPSIEATLVDLLGKPVAAATALAVPTAQWGHPMCGPVGARGFLVDGLAGLGWASVGLLELTALPSIGRDRWEPWVRETDVLLVDGGDATYLCHWLRESGLADLLPDLDSVWVGVSAGSMVMTPRIGSDFVEWPGAADDRTLGLVDFSISPTSTCSRTTPWPRPSGGPPRSAARRTSSTTSPRSPSWTAPWTSSPRAGGSDWTSRRLDRSPRRGRARCAGCSTSTSPPSARRAWPGRRGRCRC